MKFLVVVDFFMVNCRVYCLPLSNVICVPVHSYSLSLVCSTTFKVAVCGITIHEYLAMACSVALVAGVKSPWVWVGMMLVTSPDSDGVTVKKGAVDTKPISAVVFVPSTLIPWIGFSASPLAALNSEAMITSISTRQKA